MEYTFRNIKSGKIVTVDLKMSEYDEFKANNPSLERYHDTAPTFQLGRRPTSSFDSQTDNSWKEVLAKVAEKHPGSELGQKYRKKTVKEVKTEQIFEKHKKRQNPKK